MMVYNDTMCSLHIASNIARMDFKTKLHEWASILLSKQSHQHVAFHVPRMSYCSWHCFQGLWLLFSLNFFPCSQLFIKIQLFVFMWNKNIFKRVHLHFQGDTKAHFVLHSRSKFLGTNSNSFEANWILELDLA